MRLFCIAALLLALSTSLASAQPKGGEVQPDRIAVGTVYTGATVEASFLVLEPGSNAKAKLEVTAPKFVTVLRQSTEVREFGQGNSFVCGTVEIAIDTAIVGKFAGAVSVKLGQTKVKVPVSATVKPRRPGLNRLLIAGTPFEAYTTKDGTLFEAWTDLVQDSPLDVHYLLVNRGKPVLRDLDLGKFDCVFLSAEALVSATPADVKRARAYAEQGGLVVVTASRFFVGSVKQANAVLAGYGLKMRDEEAGGPQSDVTLGKDDLDPRLVKAGVKSARFFRASPVAIEDVKKGWVLARTIGVGQVGDGFVAAAQAGKGEVIAIGESLWWNWISKGQAQGTDNAKLLRWLLTPRRA